MNFRPIFVFDWTPLTSAIGFFRNISVMWNIPGNAGKRNQCQAAVRHIGRRFAMQRFTPSQTRIPAQNLRIVLTPFGSWDANWHFPSHCGHDEALTTTKSILYPNHRQTANNMKSSSRRDNRQDYFESKSRQLRRLFGWRIPVAHFVNSLLVELTFSQIGGFAFSLSFRTETQMSRYHRKLQKSERWQSIPKEIFYACFWKEEVWDDGVNEFKKFTFRSIAWQSTSILFEIQSSSPPSMAESASCDLELNSIRAHLISEC
jgi:hypothetical protein